MNRTSSFLANLIKGFLITYETQKAPASPVGWVEERNPTKPCFQQNN